MMWSDLFMRTRRMHLNIVPQFVDLIIANKFRPNIWYYGKLTL